MYKKYNKLKEQLRKLGSVAVAFSGGVDSTLLMFIAHEVLGEKAIAITAKSELFPEREHLEAINFVNKYNIKQIVMDLDVFEIAEISDNPQNRCYICKKNIFENIKILAKEQGLSSVVEGSNMDDCSDYRPGMKAIEELKILSPLKEVGLYKDEIRQLSKEFGLSTWDKPSFACLASRFVYGEKITHKKLEMVGKGEQFLLDLGFKQIRVRIHGDLARIEIGSLEMEKFMNGDLMKIVNNRLRDLGFKYVTLDLQGYRTGSMNIITD